MWAELLPKMVGGVLVDHDAPDAPTNIIGYELSETWIEIKGEAFSFGAARNMVGITGGAPGDIVVKTTFGMAATITMPNRKG